MILQGSVYILSFIEVHLNKILSSKPVEVDSGENKLVLLNHLMAYSEAKFLFFSFLCIPYNTQTNDGHVIGCTINASC